MTTVSEIAPDVFQISTFVPDFNLQFNQFLVRDDEPLLFHTGPRSMFAAVWDAVATLLDPKAVKWIGFSHLEADECRALRERQQVAPESMAVCSLVGKLVSIDDCMAVRPALGMKEGDVIYTGKYRFLFLHTPHVPHCWEAGLLSRLRIRMCWAGADRSSWSISKGRWPTICRTLRSRSRHSFGWPSCSRRLWRRCTGRPLSATAPGRSATWLQCSRMFSGRNSVRIGRLQQPFAPRSRAALRGDPYSSHMPMYALTQPKHHSNSSHPLRRLPKTSVRLLVVTMTRPFSLSNRVMCSWMPSAFEEKSPSREAKPTSRSFVTNTAP